MILKSVTISGFKSFRKRVELPVSSRTTILIGPNDHGKSNALLALEKLNPEKAFAAAEANDRLASPEAASVSFTLHLPDLEVRSLQQFTSGLNTGNASDKTNDSAGETLLTSAWEHDLEATKSIELIVQPGKPLQPKLDQLPEQFRSAVAANIVKVLPKVFLFTPEALRQLPDTVDLASLEKNEVMQGVFRLARISFALFAKSGRKRSALNPFPPLARRWISM